ncbi:unnamed protein product [Schistosoma haematobium]|nr:unnamed protein product [Schistosoma haematobium]
MKLSTTDCLVVFCVIYLIVTDPINAGTTNLCFGHNGDVFINSFYKGYEGTYNTSQLNEIVRLINSTCNKFKQYGSPKSFGKK